jgi:hypothetical protein
MKIKTGDVYLMWRMKHLIAENKIEIMGNPEDGWKEFDVRLPLTKQEEALQTESELH